MTNVRSCTRCGRPNGPQFTRCMYCGTDLPAFGAPAPAAPEVVDVQAEAAKARELLAGLSPAARAMMPREVIAKLEARVAAGDAEQAQAAPGSVSMEVAVATTDEPPSTSPASIFDVPEPSLQGDPSIPEMDALDLEAFDLADVEVADLQPLSAQELLQDDLFDISAEETEGGNDELGDAIRRGLSQGGGPFGRRDAPARVILLPDPDYLGQAHWLKHRLATTLGIDLYTAGQALQRQAPSFVAAAESYREAEAMAERLRQGGLKVLTIDRDGWLLGAEPQYVVGASSRGRQADVVFRRADGSSVHVLRSDFTWAALAAIQPDTDKIPMVADRNKRWGTAVTPTGRSLDTGGGSYVLVDLMRRSTRRPLRVRSDRFDFSCLGDQRTLAAGMNLRRLLAWISPDPDLPIELDERFKRVPHVQGAAISGGDGPGSRVCRRELEFTEYVLLSDAENHA